MSSGGPASGKFEPRRRQYTFDRSRQDRPVNPKSVRQGVKLKRDIEEIRENWLAARWLALIESIAGETAMREGLEYAVLGQTRRLQIEPGRIIAGVQGRDAKAYTTTLSVPRWTDEQWDVAARALAEQAVHAARLLAGSLPEGLGEALDDAGLEILPSNAGQLSARCSCAEPTKPWCKHVCCVAILVAAQQVAEPLVIFTLRGLGGDTFLERLREQRAMAGGGKASAGVYSARIPHVSDSAPRNFEDSVERFWEMDASVEALDLPIGPPEVSHPLLRRLGTSPFAGARFPLVGLLATCYEVVSEAVIREERGEGDEGMMG